MTKPLLAALAGIQQNPPPVWLMRQAGRYLPEYREIRSQASSFLDFCYTPRLAVEASLQPIRRFGFDAAIMFSDILVIPDALGQKVSFETGEGPRLEAIETEADFAQLRETPNWQTLAPVFETLSTLRALLPSGVTLIGFCGAPFTLACYMIAGRSAPEQVPARMLAYQQPDLFQRLIDRLTQASCAYLSRQIEAGAEVVQIFDSWSGVLPSREFELWCLQPLQHIVAHLQEHYPHVPIIAFPRGAGLHLGRLANVKGLAAVSLDTSCDIEMAKALLPSTPALQGNLDPLALVAGGQALDHAIDHMKASFSHRAHIANLGHGILPQTPITHVEHMLKRLRAEQA